MEILKSLNMKEEREIQEMQESQRRLHLVPTPATYIGAEVFNQHGKKTVEYKDRSRSWVSNYYKNLCRLQVGSDLDSIGLNLLTYEGRKPYYYNPNSESIKGEDNSDTGGILIGTGERLENFTDIDLQSPILNSVLPKLAGTITLSFTNNTFTYLIERFFVNNSGSSFNINEVGLFLKDRGGTAARILIARDLLTPTIILPHESQLKVTYTINIPFPSSI